MNTVGICDPLDTDRNAIDQFFCHYISIFYIFASHTLRQMHSNIYIIACLFNKLDYYHSSQIPNTKYLTLVGNLDTPSHTALCNSFHYWGALLFSFTIFQHLNLANHTLF